MKLTHLGTDPESKNGGSPQVYATDRDTFIVQGFKVTDPDALATLRVRGLPDHETQSRSPRGCCSSSRRPLDDDQPT